MHTHTKANSCRMCLCELMTGSGPTEWAEKCRRSCSRLMFLCTSISLLTVPFWNWKRVGVESWWEVVRSCLVQIGPSPFFWVIYSTLGHLCFSSHNLHCFIYSDTVTLLQRTLCPWTAFIVSWGLSEPITLRFIMHFIIKLFDCTLDVCSTAHWVNSCNHTEGPCSVHSAVIYYIYSPLSCTMFLFLFWYYSFR